MCKHFRNYFIAPAIKRGKEIAARRWGAPQSVVEVPSGFEPLWKVLQTFT